MTKRHFEAVALVLKTAAESRRMSHEADITAQAVIREIAISLANVFRAENPRFDCDRFLRACGLD